MPGKTTASMEHILSGSFLAKQNAEYKKMYEEMRSKLLYEESEVKVYNRLITPEVDRIRR